MKEHFQKIQSGAIIIKIINIHALKYTYLDKEIDL